MARTGKLVKVEINSKPEKMSNKEIAMEAEEILVSTITAYLQEIVDENKYANAQQTSGYYTAIYGRGRHRRYVDEKGSWSYRMVLTPTTLKRACCLAVKRLKDLD